MSFTPVEVALNQRYYDFTSVRVNGLPRFMSSALFGKHLKGLSWGDQISVSRGRGVHGIPLPRGRGDYSCSTGMELALEGFDDMTKMLAANGIDGYSDLTFNLLIQYKTQGRIMKVEWRESSLLGPDASHAQGATGGLSVKLAVDTRYILVNGVCSYARDLDQDLTGLATGGITVGV